MYKCTSLGMPSLKVGATTFKAVQKYMCWRCPAVFFAPHAGSLDVFVDALASRYKALFLSNTVCLMYTMCYRMKGIINLLQF
jgi:hypothetical protein